MPDLSAESDAASVQQRAYELKRRAVAMTADERVALEAAKWVTEAEAKAQEATGLLNDLVTAKRLRLDAEEWQLVWDRVFRFLESQVTPPDCTCSAGSNRLFPAQHATACPRFSCGRTDAATPPAQGVRDA